MRPRRAFLLGALANHILLVATNLAVRRFLGRYVAKHTERLQRGVDSELNGWAYAAENAFQGWDPAGGRQ